MDIRYSIVIPAYNEEAVLLLTYQRLKQVMDLTQEQYELIFVNDGSRDRTIDIVRDLAKRDTAVKLIDFSRNFGHQIAITAGMDYSSGAAVIVIDADLQDPPELILKMIEKWKEGYDVVYAKRSQRKGETFFKKVTAHLFYRILQASTDIEIPVDTGDFRLIDRKVCDELKRLPEKNRYVRGLVSWVGYRQIAVEYERCERFAGESKYPLKRMMKLCWDGLTSFSMKPVQLASFAGGLIFLAGLIDVFIMVLKLILGGNGINGWNWAIAVQFLLSGLSLSLMGIIGEYVGRIYDETRQRPLYIVNQSYGFAEKNGVIENENQEGRYSSGRFGNSFFAGDQGSAQRNASDCRQAGHSIHRGRGSEVRH
ncbi:glycosyltransferase family 2 protein [Desulfitobacterium sp. Sab5]|uniref:glycosyltransferase family 2 protein n=1 Tax=Desulfitobacterium nosdiversum TaxID=3375356 RepID=UPI003CF578A5